MECRQAIDLLPLFMDDALDEGTRRSLQEHLDACPSCRSELAALQSLAQDLRTHGMLKAPDDFLEKLHARTRESRLKELLRLLFYPLHVKIPVEVIGIASVAVVIFSLFHAVEPQVRMTAPQGVPSGADSVREQVVPEESRSELVPREAAPMTEKATVQAPPTQSETQSKSKQDVRLYNKKEEPAPAGVDRAVVSAPLQSMDVYIVMKGVNKLQAKGPAGAGVQAPAPSEAGDALRSGHAPAAEVAAEAEDRVLGRQDEESARPPVSRADVPMKAQALTVSPESPVLSSLKDVVASVRGTLVDVDYDGQSREPRILTARIPCDALDAFFQRIEGIAELRTPVPSALQPGGRECLVRIHLEAEETLQK